MTSVPIGAYVGVPNENDLAQEVAVEAQFASFAQTVGVTPTFMDTYVDHTIDWSQWGANATGTLNVCGSPWLGGVTPVIGIPMALALDAGNQDQAFKGITRTPTTTTSTLCCSMGKRWLSHFLHSTRLGNEPSRDALV